MEKKDRWKCSTLLNPLIIWYCSNLNVLILQKWTISWNRDRNFRNQLCIFSLNENDQLTFKYSNVEFYCVMKRKLYYYYFFFFRKHVVVFWNNGAEFRVTFLASPPTTTFPHCNHLILCILLYFYFFSFLLYKFQLEIQGATPDSDRTIE